MRHDKGTHRSETTRLPDYDYASPGWYHVVICTKGQKCVLGQIRDGIMGLSEAGCIVAQEWQRTPQVRPYVHLDAWTVMPNHVHVILGLSSDTPAQVETPRRGVSTQTNLRSHSLGAIVGQVKSISTKRIRRTGFRACGWQPRYYDRVNRNERERLATRQYVEENPLQWHLDRYHPDQQR